MFPPLVKIWSLFRLYCFSNTQNASKKHRKRHRKCTSSHFSTCSPVELCHSNLSLDFVNNVLICIGLNFESLSLKKSLKGRNLLSWNLQERWVEFWLESKNVLGSIPIWSSDFSTLINFYVIYWLIILLRIRTLSKANRNENRGAMK